MRIRYISWQWFFVFLIMLLSVVSLFIMAYSARTAISLLKGEVNKHNRSLVFNIHTEMSQNLSSWLYGDLDQIGEIMQSDLPSKEKIKQILANQGTQKLFLYEPNTGNGYWLHDAGTITKINLQSGLELKGLSQTILSNADNANPSPTQGEEIPSFNKPWKNLELAHLEVLEKKGDWQHIYSIPLLENSQIVANLYVLLDQDFYRKLLSVLTQKYSRALIEVEGWGPEFSISEGGVLGKVDKRRLDGYHSIGPFPLGKAFARVRVRTYYPAEWDLLGGPAFDSRYTQYFLAKTEQFSELIFAPLSFLIVGLLMLYWKMRTSQRKIRIQNDWIENLAHDMQTPVHALGTVVEVLSENEANQPFCRLMSMELQRMRQNARVFMQLAREGSSQKPYHLEKHDLLPIIQRAIEMASLMHRGKEPDFELIEEGLDLKLLLDRDAFMDALINILDNACKYSKGKPQVRIEGKASARGFELSISDQGYGIPSGEQDAVLKPFYRAQTEETEGIHGNGLGLSIVAKVMENHKGSIKAQKNQPKGTRIILTFPGEA